MSERFIIGGRIVLAVGGLVATYFDPTQPSQGEVGYAFLAGYVVFSLALLPTLNRPLHGRWSILAHVIELALVCLIIIYTEGPSSPYFIYFTFVLLSAALRWQWRGALITGALLSVVLIMLTTSALIVHFEQADVDRLIFRNIYLIVASVLFAFLGDQLGHSRQQSERLRLARELHDGILQTLTAVGMKLHAAASKLARDQRDSLLEIDHLLKDEQRQLRRYVEDTRQSHRLNEKQILSFRISELQSLIDHLRKLWNCDIELTMTSFENAIQSTLGNALKFIISESVANAVVHGGASQIAISVSTDPKALLVKIKDDGSGLANASGEYDDAGLNGSDIGPRSIRERVASLNGSLHLRTSLKGIELQIRLPILGTI